MTMRPPLPVSRIIPSREKILHGCWERGREEVSSLIFRLLKNDDTQQSLHSEQIPWALDRWFLDKRGLKKIRKKSGLSLGVLEVHLLVT